MRRFSRLVCLLLSVSFLLAPLSTLHAHFDSDHRQSALHGGHVHHDLDDRTGVMDDSVIDVNLAAADRGSSVFSWTHWLPLMAAFAALWMTLPYLTAVIRPPTSADRVPRTHTHYWRPPLRGPPAFAINVR